MDTARSDDANDYVEAIMSSQPVMSTSVDVTIRTRKRSLSLPDTCNENSKKSRGDSETDDSETSSGRVLAEARRSLYGSTPAAKKDQRSVGGNAEVSTCTSDVQSSDSGATGGSGPSPSTSQVDITTPEPSVTDLLKGISRDLQQLNGRLSGLENNLDTKHKSLSVRIDQLENRLEKKLSDKMAQIMDKRFTSEMRKFQKEIDTRVGGIRDDLQSDIEELAAKVDSVSESVRSGEGGSDVALNIVVRDLPEHSGENILAKINNLLKDNLKLRDVVASAAERKVSYNAKPGLVIATLESLEDKNRVLKAKSILQNSSMNKVFIHPDQSRSERLQRANLRALVDAINGGDGGISVRGNRVVRDHAAERDSRPAPRSESGNGRGRQTRGGYDADRERSSGSEDNRGGYRSLFSNDRDNRPRHGGARGGAQYGTRGGVQGGARGGSQGGARDGVRGGARGGVRGGARGTGRSYDRNPRRN